MWCRFRNFIVPNAKKEFSADQEASAALPPIRPSMYAVERVDFGSSQTVTGIQSWDSAR